MPPPPSLDRTIAAAVAEPLQTTDLRLAGLLAALSHALDLVEGQPEGHCVRCCWIGVHIGRALNLSDGELWDLYYTLLLKDLGCSSNAARICQLYLADDIDFKRGVKTVDTTSVSQALKFVLTHTGLKAGLADRIRSLAHVCAKGGEIARELVETRCHRGADIARRMRFSEAVADGIQNLDEHWDGHGLPEGRAGTDIPLKSRIALLSQVIDVFQSASGDEAALQEIRYRSGTWFDPQLVRTFEDVASTPGFWEMLRSDDLQQAVFELEPAQHVVLVDEGYLDDIAHAFAQVIDSKSPYTSGHSERVTMFTDRLAKELGLSAPRRRWLRRAALLHDIGKLGVSNSILDKAGALDEAEWMQVRQHAQFTQDILAHVAVFKEMAPVAGAHHERLDGKGYPHGLKGDEISIETRIITTADIFDALTADRPYRRAMPVAKALEIMHGMVGTAIDERCFEALKRVAAVD